MKNNLNFLWGEEYMSIQKHIQYNPIFLEMLIVIMYMNWDYNDF